jgi:cytochrome c-type biogenesis protein CcmF
MILFSFRLPILSSNKTIAALSKESFISINNIIFGTLIFSTMLGILYPLIYEFLYEQKISVGAPFYNAIYIPTTILACLFLFFSIDSKWQRGFKKSFLVTPMFISVILSIASTFVTYYLLLITDLWILISIFTGSLIIFRYLIVVKDYFLNNKYSNPFSIIAHLGLGILVISIALNSELSTERALNIKMNESDMYRDYKITFDDLRLIKRSNYDSVRASFLLTGPDGKNIELSPEKRKYFARGQVTTETAIHLTPLKDIYMTIGDQLDDGSWIVNIQFNYFIRWIWFSAIMMALGGSMLALSLVRSKQ